jgi:tryptophan halogenase
MGRQAGGRGGDLACHGVDSIQTKAPNVGPVSGGFLSKDRIQSIAIVGAGAAAWLAAATLARRLKSDFCDIRVIEMAHDPATAMSEVALPSFHRLNNLLGIDENDLVRKTRGTFRLGAQFTDWGRAGDRYFHTYGSFGAKLDAVPFHHYWIKLRKAGDPTSIEQYSTATVAATTHKFAHASLDRRSMLSLYSYGYHFHAELLAAYLRQYAQAHGVTRIVRSVIDVHLRGVDGFIDALQLDDGSRVVADLYIDCGGVPGTLFGRSLPNTFEDWGHWLPCDRAVGALCESVGDPAPYSESTAQRAGWRMRTPLQGCLDSSYVYSSRHISDDEAAATLRRDLPGAALTEPRFRRLSAGRPRRFWDKNWILTGGALDTLESTGLHLVQTGITRLLTLFPVTRYSPPDIEEYNRLTTKEHERIRDFLILHFKATQRSDAPFWDDCRAIEVPDTLQAKIDLFRRCGRIAMLDDEHFGEDSWLALFFGQNLDPQDYDPLADILDEEEVKAALSRMRSMIAEGVEKLPTHSDYIERHCSAGFGAGW